MPELYSVDSLTRELKGTELVRLAALDALPPAFEAAEPETETVG